MHPSPESIYHLQDQWFFITSPTAGVYVFDAKHETLKRYMHNPVDNNTLISNSSAYIVSDSSGFFFITPHISGIDYIKFNSKMTTVKPVFQDIITGKLYDGLVGSSARSGEGNIWLGGDSI